MKHKRVITMVRVTLVSLGLGATSWSQTSVPVANSGFEDPVVGDGSTGSPADWNDVAGGGQVFNPTASQYSSGPPEGDNVASVYQGGAGDGLSQTLSGVTGQLQEDAVYSLSVQVGDPADELFDGYKVQLLADGTVLAEDDNTVSIPDDGFTTITVPYTYDAGSHAALVGKPLEIRLLSKALNSGDVHFDGVQLTVTLTTPIADPGGPFAVASPGGSLSLDGRGSRPSDGDGITLYEWDLNNDGTFGDVTGATPAAISDADLIANWGMELGPNTIGLRVTDSDQTATATTTVTLFEPPVSIDFNGAGGPTHSGEPDNANGLQLPGQVGLWNAFTVAATVGAQSITTAEGPTFTLNPAGGGPGFEVYNQSGSNLRKDIIAMNTDRGSYAGAVPWELTGLVPNGEYSLIFFQGSGFASCQITITGAGAGTLDADNDYNFTGVLANGAGKISGTMDTTTAGAWYATSGLQFKQTGDGGPDITPPAIVSKDPDGVSNVDPGGNLVATFNENIALKAGGTITITDTDDGTGSVVINLLDPTQVTVSGSDLIIDPGTDLEFGTNFEVVISNDAIADTTTTPNVYPGTTAGQWTFTTAVQDLTGPVISIDFNVGGSATYAGEPNNAAGLQLPGQVGAWNAFTVAAVAGAQSITTAEGPTFTITPGGGGPGFAVYNQIAPPSYNEMRGDIIAMNPGAGHTTAVPWELAGLVPNGEYSLIFFERGNYGGAYTTIDGVGVGTTEATEKDYDFTGVTADGTGKISGTFSAPTATWYSWAGLQFKQTGTSGGNNFSDWIAGYDVGAMTGINDDPDGDGVDSGVENFLGTAPDIFTQGLVPGTVSGNAFTFTHPQGTLADDLAAGYRWSTDLQTFHGDGATGGGGTKVDFSVQLDTPEAGTTTVTATISGTVIPSKLFVDVEVTQN